MNIARMILAAFLLMLCSAASAMGFNLPKLDELERSLQLTPPQKEQYDLAVGATKRVMLSMALATMQAKERLAQELAKPNPDLSVLADLRRAIIEDAKPLRREARDEWRKFYDLLDRDQVATLRRFVDDQLDQVGMLHEFLLQLILGREQRPPREPIY
jgi:hypothetical protein